MYIDGGIDHDATEQAAGSKAVVSEACASIGGGIDHDTWVPDEPTPGSGTECG